MNKPVIAVDIDDTVFEHFGSLARWYNREYGTNLTLADNHPKGEEALLVWKAETIHEAVRRVHLFYDTKEHIEAVPFEEAIEALTVLSKNFELIFVTARDTILEEFTREWLQKHFTGLYTEVHFTSFYSLEGKSRSKKEVLEQIEAKYLIDDSLPNCEAAVEAGALGLLFGDYPWNEADELPELIVRCKDWQEVTEYFGVS